jgi:dTDP-glucose pyrophosphorylase
LATKGSTTVYNTLRLDAKQRAIKEIQETVLPAMKRFAVAVVNSADIKNFGVVVAYGSRDFSDELSTKAEVVALVASAERCKKLADAELTEEEFVDAADVYVMDRDSINDLRKIKASIEDNKGK